MDKQINHNAIESKNSSFKSKQEDYIHALESSVQLLQNEVELLRNIDGFNKQMAAENDNLEFISNKNRVDFLEAKNESDLVEKLHSKLSNHIPILESNLYICSPNKKIQPYYKSNTALALFNKIDNLEEQGIIDWAIEKKELSFILDLEQSSSKKNQFIIIYPIFTRGQIFSIFFALTNTAYEDLEQSKIDYIKSIIEDAALALDNIKSLKEIAIMNQRLNHLNSKMMESSLFASIGEFASSLIKDIETPISIVNANLDLIDAGIGDSKQRIKIIKKQLNILDGLKNKLNELTLNLQAENDKKNIDLSKIIDDVLFFTNFQFQREAIRVIKDYENAEFHIFGYQSQIEQAIFNILLNARIYLPEGGEIRINMFIDGLNRVIITFSDNGKGISDENKIKLFEPFNQKSISNNKFNMGLYYSKQIIEMHKGKISVYSELSKGTTIKITFPSNYK